MRAGKIGRAHALALDQCGKRHAVAVDECSIEPARSDQQLDQPRIGFGCGKRVVSCLNRRDAAPIPDRPAAAPRRDSIADDLGAGRRDCVRAGFRRPVDVQRALSQRLRRESAAVSAPADGPSAPFRARAGIAIFPKPRVANPAQSPEQTGLAKRPSQDALHFRPEPLFARLHKSIAV